MSVVNKPTALSNHAGDGRADNACISRNNWLRELEKARWRDSQQTKNASSGERAETEPDSAGAVAAIAPPFRIDLAGADVASQFRGVTVAVPSEETGADASFEAIPEGDRTVCHEAAQTCDLSFDANRVGWEIQRLPGGAVRPSAVGASFPKPCPEANKWQKQNIHAVATQNDVVVWIRDPETRQAENLSLLAKLSASLAKIGKRLVGLTVNGQPVQEMRSGRSR